MDANTPCYSVREWIEQAARSGQLDAPSEQLCSHVAGCTRCRGALLLLLAEVSAVPSQVADTSCEACQDDMAAYIDLEREAGTPTAVCEYPHVWWHLVVCRDCFTTYQMTTVLVEAECRGELMPLAAVVCSAGSAPPSPSTQAPSGRRPRLLKRLHIPRRVLSQTLTTQPLPGIMRGAREEHTVLFDEAVSGYTMTLSVQEQADATWNVRVDVVLPIRGQVVLTFGTTLFCAPFDADGQAVIANVPADLLTASDGPDMDLSIELDAGELDMPDTD